MEKRYSQQGGNSLPETGLQKVYALNPQWAKNQFLESIGLLGVDLSHRRGRGVEIRSTAEHFKEGLTLLPFLAKPFYSGSAVEK